MTEMAELVAAVYRADWTQLSLSARITRRRDHAVYRQLRKLHAEELRQAMGPMPGPWRLPDHDPGPGADWPESEQRVLIGPGGRYRLEADDGRVTAVCDGESPWAISGGVARRFPARGPDSAFRGLVAPQWLLACYDLEITGRTQRAGRTVRQVTGLPRAVTTRPGPGDYHRLDRVDVLIDAELGIVLRSEQVLGGQTLELAEMHDLVVDPTETGDPGLFRPPPGMPEEEHQGLGAFEPQGRGWQAAMTAADAAATAMGFAVRHAPHRPRPRAAGDDEPDMPPDAYGFAAASANREPLSDDLVNLLHRTGLPAQDFGADLHQWLNAEMAIRASQAFRTLPQPLDGVLGPDALWNALEERGREAGCAHRTGRLRVWMPGRYRIDQMTGNWRGRYRAIACDGEHTRKLYDDRVATGLASPLREEFAELTDPAWLLHKWNLSVAGETSVGGRRGYRIIAEARDWSISFAQDRASSAEDRDRPADIPHDRPFSPVEVIVDAELGILLRQTSYVGDRPAVRSELRNLIPGTSPGDFRIDAGPGLRDVADTSGPFADRDLPTPLKAAGTAAVLAAGGAVVGAVAVTGWLQKRRARPEFHDRG